MLKWKCRLGLLPRNARYVLGCERRRQRKNSDTFCRVEYIMMLFRNSNKRTSSCVGQQVLRASVRVGCLVGRFRRSR